MQLILSPAKNLNENTDKKSLNEPKLLEESCQIMQVMKNFDAIDLQELMGVSHAIAHLNVLRNQAWQMPFVSPKPALYLFDGDAYKGLDAPSLNSSQVAYLDERLCILSGLYGLLSPLDGILPYRLEMGTKLSIGTASTLYDFWGDTLTQALNERIVQTNSTVLVNVASQEYFKAIRPKKLTVPVIDVQFLDKKGQQYKTISFYAKRARGLLVRFCALNNITNPDELKSFDLEGYCFDPSTSSEHTLVFKRDHDA